MLARRVKLHVDIGGHDATDYMNASVMEFEYIDHESGKADEVRLSLHDRDGHWSGDWRPRKGTEINASFTVVNWMETEQDEEKEITFPCGRFTVDEIEFSGPPDRVEIKALSASLTSSIRDTKRTQAWERYSLQGIAAEIAGRNGLGLMYTAHEHNFGRKDQRDEADLTFLQRLASACGVKCKVHENKLVLFDADDADQAEPVLTIPKSGSQFSPSRYRFLDSSSDTGYRRAVVKYTDPTTGKLQKAEVEVKGEDK